MTILFIQPTYANISEWVRSCARAVNQLIQMAGPPLSAQSITVAQRDITGDDAIATTDYLVAADATAAAVTVTLPPVQSGRIIIVKKVDASANNVVVDGNGAETIDGAANKTLTTQYESVTVIGGSLQWLIV